MRTRIPIAMAAAAVAVVASGCLPAPPAPPNFRAETVADINAVRASYGIGPVYECGPLDVAAQSHSVDMAVHQYVGDIGSDGSNVLAREFRSGYAATAAGENVAAGQSTVAQAMYGLETDPAHLAIILNPGYVAVGVGLATTGLGYHYYWTQDFGVGGGC